FVLLVYFFILPRYATLVHDLHLNFYLVAFLLRPFQFSPFLPHDCVSLRVFVAYLLYISSIHSLHSLHSSSAL
ncbi:hypothetical protein B0H17DRAFT_1110932, partial [Mycena rosella]